MRLLTYDNRGELSTTEDFADDDVPPYAILSHTWGKDKEEVTLHEVRMAASRQKIGYQKIEFCGRQARQDGWRHFWVDTCCIDKANQVELSRAITSMYRWYQQAQVCYVYLADVSCRQDDPTGAYFPRTWEASFYRSRWFTRGWTLQELLAPREVVFYSREGSRLGTKRELRDLLHDITGIPTAALDGQPLSQFPVIERMRWTQGRKTREKEDQAYCLLGIFEVYIPLMYGEGDYAFRRLQQEINAQTGGQGSVCLPAITEHLTSYTTFTKSANTGSQTGHNTGSIVNHFYGPRSSNEVVDLSHRSAEVRPLGLCLNSAPLIQPGEFVGRTAEIDAVHDILQPDGYQVQQRRAVLGGIGGVGKTQLAVAYARQYKCSYTSTLWLNASSELALYSNLRSVASSLMAAGELEKLDNEQVRGRLFKWLSDSRNTHWLMIFDNHDDPDQFDIGRFCPTIGHGAIVVTTRLPDRVTGTKVLVRPLTAIDDALTVLQIRSGREDVKEDTGARRLAERMAGLPLALVTAGAFLRKSTLSFQQYLDIYEQRWQVDRRRPLQLLEYADRTLYTTWNLSYSRLEADDAEATQMLQLLAYFDHQAIWYELVRAGLSEGSPQWLQACSTEQVDFESVMSRLVEYCFVEVQATTGSYSIHACVHDWTLGELNRDVDPTLYWYTFDCVARSISHEPWESLGHTRHAKMTPHAVRLAHPRLKTAGQDIVSARLQGAEDVAVLLEQQVRLDAAAIMRKRALAGREKALGPDHTDTLGTVNNLGSLYLAQGKLEAAEQMYERALAGREKALGPNHTDTLGTVNNLAVLYHDQGKLEAAEQMYQQALAGREKALGPDHTDTLSTVNNLAILYNKQGKLEAAEQMYERALAGREKALGPDHPSTRRTIRNLDSLYHSRGWTDRLASPSRTTAVAREAELTISGDVPEVVGGGRTSGSATTAIAGETEPIISSNIPKAANGVHASSPVMAAETYTKPSSRHGQRKRDRWRQLISRR